MVDRSGWNLQEAIAGAQLPALPQCAIRLLHLSHDSRNGAREYAEPIEADIGMSTQVLKFVNSSYFGFAREITNVRMAVLMIGLHPIMTFCLWRGVYALMPNPKCGPFLLQRLWQDSLRRALLSRIVARLLNSADPEEAFAAALLQDMAVPVLARQSPAVYKELLEARAESATRLSDLERAAFGWTHADAGAAMCRMWCFPETLAAALAGHLDDGNPAANLAAVSLSARLPSVVDATWRDRPLFEEQFQRLRLASPTSAPELLAEVDRQYQSFAPVLGMTTPPQSLVERCRD